MRLHWLDLFLLKTISLYNNNKNYILQLYTTLYQADSDTFGDQTYLYAIHCNIARSLDLVKHHLYHIHIVLAREVNHSSIVSYCCNRQPLPMIFVFFAQSLVWLALDQCRLWVFSLQSARLLEWYANHKLLSLNMIPIIIHTGTLYLVDIETSTSYNHRSLHSIDCFLPHEFLRDLSHICFIIRMSYDDLSWDQVNICSTLGVVSCTTPIRSLLFCVGACSPIEKHEASDLSYYWYSAVSSLIQTWSDLVSIQVTYRSCSRTLCYQI